MGYTIFIRERIMNAMATVHGPDGDELRPAPIPQPAYPATFIRQVYADLTGIYGEDPTRRVELWEDSAGGATSAEIFAACPGLRPWLGMQIRAEGDRRLRALVMPYLDTERETWHVQQAEAERWMNHEPAAELPMISSIAAARGIAVGDLVGKIMENVNAFRIASGEILGQQQALLDRLYSASTIETLLAIAWP